MRAWQANRWYWELGGRPALLLGGADEDNVFNDPALLEATFAKLERCGGNYLRATLSARRPGNVQPYAMPDDRYDLYRFNAEYWDRLDYCCREARRRGMAVTVEIWARGDFYGEAWRSNPFNPAANLNYHARNTVLPPAWPFAPGEKTQPFFRTVPDDLYDETVLAFQRAFVDKALDTTLRHDNVMYSLDSAEAPAAWADFWGEYVRREAAMRGYQPALTEPCGEAGVHALAESRAFARPDLFDFLDVSAVNAQSGVDHWHAIAWLRRRVGALGGGRSAARQRLGPGRRRGRPARRLGRVGALLAKRPRRVRGVAVRREVRRRAWAGAERKRAGDRRRRARVYEGLRRLLGRAAPGPPRGRAAHGRVLHGE